MVTPHSKPFIHFKGIYLDQYELSMAQVYYLSGRSELSSTFDYYFRNIPFNGGYVVFAGLNDLLQILTEMRFGHEEICYLEELGFDSEFLNYLKNFRFRGTIYSYDEGQIAFPYAPVMRVEGTILEAQLVETILLNIINFQSLVATKARRIKSVAIDKTFMEFGLRRAHGPGGYYAARASIIGGFDSTSNVLAGKDYHLHTSGTMAHSFIQSEDSEIEAFRHFADCWPESTILLIDTYNTLESGLPNAIRIAKEMEHKGHRLKGIRLDSGDLSYLSKECRKKLDAEGLQYVAIYASSDLDEYAIQDLMQERSPIDGFGVGTHLVTGAPDGALDGVYKLCSMNHIPKLKISDDLKKLNFPGRKQVFRLINHNNDFVGADIITLEDEVQIKMLHDPFEGFTSLPIEELRKMPLMKKYMKNGERLYKSPTVDDIRIFSESQLARLPENYKKINHPDLYHVGLSDELLHLRDKLIQNYRQDYEKPYHH